MTLGELKKYLNGFKRLKGTGMIWYPDDNPPHPPENLESPDDVEVEISWRGDWEKLDGLMFVGSARLAPVGKAEQRK